MAESWDTFTLFQGLLDDFAALLNGARNLSSSNDQLAIRMSIAGFARFSPASEWHEQHVAFILQRLQGEFSPDELDWYEECAQSISVFACLSLGALLGKFHSGEIDEAGFVLGDAHLAAFLALHNEAICASYAAAM